ncbi:hypothetical protein [Desertimonas flava]|uniref:hypothetical protein n=1 Tax=Desertimonas flava TaxID=2064846 RepID=UPI000E343956|nr:hypothetical protein [Desertimonas flava]
MRRHHLAAVTALAALVPAGAAVASVPPDTEPVMGTADSAPADTGMATAPAPSMPADTSVGSAPVGEAAPAPAGAVTVFDDEGNEVASIAVGAIEPGWVDYDPDNAPDEGREYLRVTVTVTSMVTEDTFGVAMDDFVLQDAHGFLDTADNVATAAQAENDEEIVEEADLANGESVELALTFEVDPAVGGQSVFYQPDEDRLVDVTEVA